MLQMKQAQINYTKDLPRVNTRLALVLLNHIVAVNEPPPVYGQIEYMKPKMPCGWCFVFACILFLGGLYYINH